MTHKQWLRRLPVWGVVVLLGISMGFVSQRLGTAWAAEPIKVGILHSLSSTMAISETPVKEVVLMAIDEINKEGTTILLVEQNANAALKHSHRAYVLETGSIVMEGPSEKLAADPRVKEAYLGE